VIDAPPPSTRRRGSEVRPFQLGLTWLSLVVFVATTGTTAPARRAQRGLSGASELAQTYTAILDARFEDVPQLLVRTCGPAPREACELLEAVSLWWRIQLDPASRARDAAFEVRVDQAIAAAEAWTRREPERAEAWFYLGGSYGARSQWRALRGSRLAAARDGKRIKEALERTLAIDPTIADAHFGIGLYRYYADVVPAAARILQWLLLLPGGDRNAGLQEIQRARQDGLLLRSEADYQLHLLYLWYEQRPEAAMTLLEGLAQRHPRNPHFQQAIAEVHDVYLHDAAASLRSWQSLLNAARAGRVAEPHLAETAARLGIAQQLDRLSRSDEALDHLRAVIAARAPAPFAAVAKAHLLMGDALSHLGRRREAVESYQNAIAEAGRGDPLRIAARARAAIRMRP